VLEPNRPRKPLEPDVPSFSFDVSNRLPETEICLAMVPAILAIDVSIERSAISMLFEYSRSLLVFAATISRLRAMLSLLALLSPRTVPVPAAA
jgi:hypothetical protein